MREECGGLGIFDSDIKYKCVGCMPSSESLREYFPFLLSLSALENCVWNGWEVAPVGGIYMQGFEENFGSLLDTQLSDSLVYKALSC